MATYADLRPPVPAQARTLESRWYTDAAVFGRELERLFFADWVWAGRGSEIPRSGDYLLFELADESVIVVRGTGGRLHASHNLCRHRGTRLVTEARGRFGAGAIQCPYHAWTYDLDGRLRRAPGMSRSEGFEPGEHGLQDVEVDEWDGHIFISLAATERSLRAHLDDLPAKLGPWGMDDLVPIHRTRYSVMANWKLIVQNYSECLHCPVAHPQLQSLSHYLSGDNDRPHAAYLGGRMELRLGVRSLTADGRALTVPLPGLSAADQRTVAFYSLLPNLLLNLHPDYMMTFALAPRKVDRTDIECTWYVHSDSSQQAGFDPSPAISFWDQTNRQDWELCERAQRGLASRAYRPGPYSNREELLWAFDRWLLERLGDGRSEDGD